MNTAEEPYFRGVVDHGSSPRCRKPDVAQPNLERRDPAA